jgi:Domain of unknown function (DUF4328)
VDAPVARFVTFWWICWILSNWLSWVAARGAFNGDDAESLRTATSIYLVGDTVDIVAAALAILYVRRVTARQRLRAERRDAAASIAA